MQACRGIRGATTADANTDEAIYSATRDMLQELINVNGIDQEQVAAAYFTVTSDLNAAFPAAAARQLGWNEVLTMGRTSRRLSSKPAPRIRGPSVAGKFG